MDQNVCTRFFVISSVRKMNHVTNNSICPNFIFYFPEDSQEYKQHGSDTPIYCFPICGAILSADFAA